MTTPVNGYVPAEFLAPLDGSGVLAERSTARAFNALHAAHPEMYVNSGQVSGYWSRALDVAMHANPAAYGVTDENLSGIGGSKHGLGIRINIQHADPAVCAQFGFSEFNPYTFTYTGTPSWDEAAPAPAPAPAPAVNLEVIAHQVMAGQWGNGPDRRARLTAAGYDPAAVQTVVNALLSGRTAPAPVPAPVDLTVIAREVIAGKWGNGPDRRSRLTIAGYSPAAVQAIVNGLLGAPAAPAAVSAPVPAPALPAAPVLPAAPELIPISLATPAAPLPAPTPTKVATVSTPTPAPVPALTAAEIAADLAKLQADAASIDGTVAGQPLSGLLAGRPKARKRGYYAYAFLALLISFGPDVITAGVLTAHTQPVFVASIGFATSVLLKVGVAFGFVAASNTNS